MQLVRRRPLTVGALALLALLFFGLVATQPSTARTSMKCAIYGGKLSDAEKSLAGATRQKKKAQRKVKAANQAIARAKSKQAKLAAKKRRNEAKAERDEAQARVKRERNEIGELKQILREHCE